ncbi:hypothetical protein AB9M93_05850 [Peribacillus frigoritolerans]|uniref:hypothetical protein n=1 Tax=Peribacillus frigoritolerans TaxID=450367 RepID=UPI003513D598
MDSTNTLLYKGLFLDLDIGLFILVLNQLIEIIPKIVPLAELVLYCKPDLRKIGLGQFLEQLV